MPEGDTIFRAATRLRPILQGRCIELARAKDSTLGVESLTGQTLTAVDARGKHLLMHFADGRALHSHMGMTGSWHIYRRGEPWLKPEIRAAVVLETATHTVPCFTPKTLELLTEAGIRRHPYLQRLGPDLLAGDPAADEVLRRFRSNNSVPIGQAVMNQTIVCGIGNVYKSEVLFLQAIDPFRTVQSLTDDQILAIVAKARELMQQNLEGYPRTTRHALDGRRQWTYGRSGQPCFRCGTNIQMRRQGDLGRSTYWCPQCQPAEASAQSAES